MASAAFFRPICDTSSRRNGEPPFDRAQAGSEFMAHRIFLGALVLAASETTYILINNADHARRIFTDGRDWPGNLENLEPTYQGYSIGRWIVEDGDGRHAVLEVETRGPFKGPRSYDGSGLPLHHDNRSIFKERYRRSPNPQPLLRAKSSHYQSYSITSSAMASSAGGTSMPSARAVCELMTSSNLVD
jgi:hypothetical protein